MIERPDQQSLLRFGDENPGSGWGYLERISRTKEYLVSLEKFLIK